MAHPARDRGRQDHRRTGRPLPFMEWVAELDDQKQKFDANPKSAERLTETERRAIDVGRRLVTYKAYQRRRAAVGRAWSGSCPGRSAPRPWATSPP